METLSRVLPARARGCVASAEGGHCQRRGVCGGLWSQSPHWCLCSACGCPCVSVVPMHRLSCWGLPYLVALYFFFFFLVIFFKIFKLHNLLGNCSFQINLRCARYCRAVPGAHTEPAVPHVAPRRAAWGWLLLGRSIP